MKQARAKKVKSKKELDAERKQAEQTEKMKSKVNDEMEKVSRICKLVDQRTRFLMAVTVDQSLARQSWQGLQRCGGDEHWLLLFQLCPPQRRRQRSDNESGRFQPSYRH